MFLHLSVHAYDFSRSINRGDTEEGRPHERDNFSPVFFFRREGLGNTGLLCRESVDTGKNSRPRGDMLKGQKGSHLEQKCINKVDRLSR